MKFHFNPKMLKEPSTWRGIAALATVAGVNIVPEMQTQLMMGFGLLYGLINTFRKEDKPKEDK